VTLEETTNCQLSSSGAEKYESIELESEEKYSWKYNKIKADPRSKRQNYHTA